MPNGQPMVFLSSSLLLSLLTVACLVLYKFYKFWKKIAFRQYPRRATHQVCSLLSTQPQLRQPPIFAHPHTGHQSIVDEPQYALTIIIPAYQEARRLPHMLKSTLLYLQDRAAKDASFAAEVIIVNDGSTDGTIELATSMLAAAELAWLSTKSQVHLKFIQFPHNMGKGAAVAEGLLSALGENILFADADGSTSIQDVEKLELAIEKGAGLACGSRASQVSGKNVKVKRAPFRKLLMRAFSLFISIWGVSQVKDTQCGFKLLTRHAASLIAPYLHINGWIFDIELILLAERLGIHVAEVSVNWTEMTGSKLSLAVDSIDMALDLIFMRMAYRFKLWPCPAKLKRNSWSTNIKHFLTTTGACSQHVKESVCVDRPSKKSHPIAALN